MIAKLFFHSPCTVVLTILLISHQAAWAVAAEDDNTLGTLFHSPEVRQTLEEKRGIQPKPRLIKPAHKPRKHRKVVKAKPALPLPDPILLQGYVKRTDGPSTVWINHEVVSENTKTQNIKVGRLVKLKQNKKNSVLSDTHQLHKSNHLVIKVPANGKVIKLKPGQRYDAKDHRIDDISTMAIDE